MITVYTKPGCLPCKRVLSKILEAGLEHRVKDITQDKAALDHLAAIGARSVPVIEVDGGETILGYDPIKLKELLDAAGT